MGVSADVASFPADRADRAAEIELTIRATSTWMASCRGSVSDYHRHCLCNLSEAVTVDRELPCDNCAYLLREGTASWLSVTY